MGPAIATGDDIPDVTRLRVQTWVNGELRQQGCVADLIFAIPTLIETLSRTMTLEPGDILATGGQEFTLGVTGGAVTGLQADPAEFASGDTVDTTAIGRGRMPPISSSTIRRIRSW